MIFTVGLSVAIRMSLRWSATELERREAVKSRTEAELKNLRNQLNPHFLLNTLNNIYALTAFDTEKAQQAIQELSKLLRQHLLLDESLCLAAETRGQTQLRVPGRQESNGGRVCY